MVDLLMIANFVQIACKQQEFGSTSCCECVPLLVAHTHNITSSQLAW